MTKHEVPGRIDPERSSIEIVMVSSKTWSAGSLRPAGYSRAERLARLDRLARLFDTALVVPGTNIRFGLDALIGLVPGIGDVVTTAASLYIIHEARQLGAPGHLIGRMLGNVVLDGVVGSIPILGDVFDTFWRSNRRNMALLKDHLQRQR